MKVRKALRHFFIPHEHNDYKPHFFREVSVAIVVLASIFMLGFSAGSSFLINRTVLGANISTSVLVDLTNESRLALNQAPLLRNPVLDRAAEMKAEDMATKGYFAHTSPEGTTPWHWFREAGYNFLFAGENLAINFVDPEAIRNAWLASPKHRENLLSVNFKEIGMATVSGVYEGGPSIYVVQMFGTPAKAAVKPATPTEAVATASTTTEKETETGEVKGESATTTEPVNPEDSYNPIFTTSELAIVKNKENVEEVMVPALVENYSKWYERFLFGGSYYVDMAYKALIVLVFIALLAMIFIEVRKQHWRHILYGLGMLLILSLSLFINQAFF